MFTRAFKEMEDKDWEKGPCTTNPVEALNRQSVQEGCTVLHTLMENIYLEDRLQAVKQHFVLLLPKGHQLVNGKRNANIQALGIQWKKVHQTSTGICSIQKGSQMVRL